MALERRRRPYRPRKPRERGYSGLLYGVIGVLIAAAGIGLCWLAFIWSFEVEADAAAGMRIGNLRFAASDSIDVIGVLALGFIGLTLVVVGVQVIISEMGVWRIRANQHLVC